MLPFKRKFIFRTENLYLYNRMHHFNQNTSKRKEQKFFSRITKIETRFFVQLSIQRSGVSILHMNTQLNPLKILENPERLINDPNALWKDLVPYQLNLILNSSQGVASFKQTLTLSRQKFEKKLKFFRYLVNVWLHFMKIINFH